MTIDQDEVRDFIAQALADEYAGEADVFEQGRLLIVQPEEGLPVIVNVSAAKHEKRKIEPTG